MNRDLVRSPHVVAALVAVVLLCVAALVWSGPSAPFRWPGREFQLGSGFVALALVIAVGAYGARKYAHRGGYSPEFRMAKEFEALERAERRVRELLPRIASGSLRERRDVERAAAAVLREEGVARLRRAVAEPGAPGEPPWKLRIVPTEPLGRVRRWMKVHLAWGTAFAIVVLLHSRAAFSSPIAISLTLVVVAVWVSGLVGLVAWMRGPLLLTRAERDLSIEEAHALDVTLGRKWAAALAELPAPLAAAATRVRAGGSAAAELAAVIDDVERSRLEDACVLAAQTRLVADEHARLARIRRSMTVWKLVHVPAAIALFVLTLLHVAAIWRY